jgi:hypothetical protein
VPLQQRDDSPRLHGAFAIRILASVRLLPNRKKDDDLLSAAQRQVDIAQIAARAAVETANPDTVSGSGLEMRYFYAQREPGQGRPVTAASAARAASLAAESARAAEQAALLLSIQVKLARSTNTFRAWQQVPAWALGATGIALAFVLASSGSASNAGWVTVSVILVLAVVASFRGPANIRFGSGGTEANEGLGGGDRRDAVGTSTGSDDAELLPDPGLDEIQPDPEAALEDLLRTPEPQGSSIVRPTGQGAGSSLTIGSGNASSTQFLQTGRHFQTRAPLIPALGSAEFTERLAAVLVERADEVRDITRGTSAGTALRGERERVRMVDRGDPRAAGWTFLVSAADPALDTITKIIRPLAELRGMRDPGAPLIFDPAMSWTDWLTSAYQGLEPRDRPYYVLVVGSPQLVPFHFQALLDSTSATGRVAFDRLDDLDSYVTKVIRLEQAQKAATRPEAVFFAPDAGPDDATYFSRKFLAEPLCAGMANEQIATRMLAGPDALKASLAAALRGAAPALVYTASHGAAAPGQPFELQRAVNGAICCQDESADWLFSAADVPGDDEPFLEGAAFFQFACYGYGTPAQSDFMHWLGAPATSTDADFVAALPTRLLRHPRGPLTYVGHVDTAWLHGFADPQDPHAAAAYSERLRPFRTAVNLLVNSQPSGLALDELNQRFDLLNGVLVNALDRMQRGEREPVLQLADTFIFRSDAQNHLLLGDPGVRIRIDD